MRRWSASELVIAVAGVLSCAVPTAAIAAWQRAESPHFNVLARGPGAAAEKRARNLERLHQAMLLTLGIANDDGANRPPVDLVFKDGVNIVASVFPDLGDATVGVFTQTADGAVAFLSLVRGIGRSDFTIRSVYHQYAHRVMAQYGRLHYPLWYVEGFADYFGSTSIEGDEIAIGAGMGGSSVLDRADWIDAPKLLKWSLKPAGSTDREDGDPALFSSQAWLLTHYLLADSARTERFNEYFRRVDAGQDALEAFEPATGIAVDQLNAELRAYRQKMYGFRLPASALPAAQVRVADVPDDEAETAVDTLIVKAGPPAKVGTAVVARLRERVNQAGGERAPDAMRLALAYAEIRFGDVDRALLILAPWAGRADRPFEASRLLGWAWQAVATTSEGPDRAQALEQARVFLMAAYKLRRNDAPTLYQLARVLQHKGPSASLGNAAEAASRLEPRFFEYGHLAVTVQLESGQRDKAQRGLQALASNSHGGLGAVRARAALQALQSGKEASEVLAFLNGTKKATP